MMKKAIVGAMIFGSVILAGCSSKHADIAQVQSDVQTVAQKVDVLEKDVNALKQETAIAQGEAARANQRLDNQVSTYRK